MGGGRWGGLRYFADVLLHPFQGFPLVLEAVVGAVHFLGG